MVFWKNLNGVMVRYGVPEPKFKEFKEFMEDSAQTNWNAVKMIYGNSDAMIPIED